MERVLEPYLVEPYLVEPYLVEPHLVYIAEESTSELYPANSESGAPVVFLELPSVAEQFRGILTVLAARQKGVLSIIFR